jgi:hypothetical protein
MKKISFSKSRAKRLVGKCLFCEENDLKILHCHRIIPGGTYCFKNTAIVCPNCHAKIHSNRIIIEGKYFSTGGFWVVYYTEDCISKTQTSIC